MRFAFSSRTRWSTLVLATVIAILIIFLYGAFVRNPVVFDDVYFFNGSIHTEYLGKAWSFSLRWLPYATFEWTRALFGLDLIWFHLGNTALHIANVVLLFLFLCRLFRSVLDDDNCVHFGSITSLTWIAFFSALIFAVHPVTVYAVTYLSQRSTLMATCFMLIMLNVALIGILRDRAWYLVLSSIAYLFAVLSKEHAIMAPALVLMLVLLVGTPTKKTFQRILPSFALYGGIALFVVYQVKMKNVLGQAYEISATDVLSRLSHGGVSFDPGLAYPLSILTQSFLFFKYLFVWMVPSPAWMSVDMVENFATRLWSPYVFSAVCFLLYPFIAIRLLLKRGAKGLLGFAMLCPWLLFATEFTTVRIQEPFVLYRSYIWMVGAFAATPFILQKLSAKHSVHVLAIATLLMLPLAWARLSTFTHPLLLWDDAARLIASDDSRPGVERIYYNRGLQFLRLKMYPQAIRDFDRALAVNPQSFYAYNNRGVAYLEMHEYQKAATDFKEVVTLRPADPKAYLGLIKIYEALGDNEEVRTYKEKLCSLREEKNC